jgi:pre-mRNA-processing factor 17
MLDSRQLVDPTSKELTFNPKVEDLYAPSVGPTNPFKTKQQLAHKNMLSGFAEPAHVDKFHFEAQRRTFESFGESSEPFLSNHHYTNANYYPSLFVR